MRALHLYSERFPPGGSIDARTVKRALGRSKYDPWSIFLRETLQNSWDARLEEDGPITFNVDAWFASKEQIRTLRDVVFSDLPPGVDLADDLAEGQLPVLVVSDNGTRGLSGPTRADQATSEETDFVDFVRNIGRDEKKGLAGGTYGLGKGVLFKHSVHSTILVFSRTTHYGRPVSRLIGMAMAAPYDDGRLRFTGRHWWGDQDDATGANPVTGRRAEELASDLGLDVLPEGCTGTAIMVLAPAALAEGDWKGEDGLEDVVYRMADAAAWHAWPHMSGSIATPSIYLGFSYEGEHVEPPDPSKHPVLRHYVAAYRHAVELLIGKAQAGEVGLYTLAELRSERPSRRLGVLAYRRYPREGVTVRPPFGDVGTHVALLRNPRLVVRYLPVSREADAHGIAGVFIADPGLDEKFALSEPVTHDDWVPQRAQEEQYERNPVRQALDRIRTAFRPRPVAVPDEGGVGRFPGIMAIAGGLGGLLAGKVRGSDAGTPSLPALGGNGQSVARAGGGGAGSGGGGSGGRRSNRATARLGLTTRLLVTPAGETAVEFDVDVDVPSGTTAQVHAQPRVVLDGGSFESPDDAPAGAPLPRILGWRDPSSADVMAGDVLTVAGPSTSRWVVRLSQPNDTAVTLVVRAQVVHP